MSAAATHRQRKEQQFLWEVFDKKPGSYFPPIYVENSGLGLLANAMQSSSFVSLPNNVIGYNWGYYGLLEEAKHRCLSPGSGYSSPRQLALNSPFPEASCFT